MEAVLVLTPGSLSGVPWGAPNSMTRMPPGWRPLGGANGGARGVGACGGEGHARSGSWDFERGCALCGGRCATDPLSAALQFAVRMHAGDGAGSGAAAEMLHTVSTSPDVRQFGFEPSEVDMQLMLEIRGALTAQQCLQQAGGAHSGGRFAEKPRVLLVGRADERLKMAGGPGDPEGPHMRSGKKDPKDPTIEVRTPSSRGGSQLFGEIGYSMPLFNCGLTKDSWMYQEVEIHEHGVMMNRDGTRDGKTKRTTIIHEVFKVGLDGCTIRDVHSVGNQFRDYNRPQDIGCLLCDYTVVREVRQYKDATVTAPSDRIGRGVEAPSGIPPDAHRMFGVEDFHVIHFRQTGTSCLMKGKGVSWTNPHVKVGKRTFYNKWEMAFAWSIPCPPGRREPSDPTPTPSELQDPTPPEPPSSPRVFTSPGFALGGEEVPPAASGWRSNEDDDPSPARPGFDSVPVPKSPEEPK